MKSICIALTRYAALSVMMTLACFRVAFGDTPNSYVNGSYVVSGQTSNGYTFQESLYFDGVGNFYGSGTSNLNGTISAFYDSGTYSVQANGQITAFDANGSITTGSVSADGNTFVGNYLTAGQVPTIIVAIKQNQIGQFNTAAGLRSLFSNTSGMQDSAFGEEALYSNTTGNTNTASGFSALFVNTSGSRNNASGGYAMYNTTSSDNNAMGYVAMYANTTGTLNSAVGNFSLRYNTVGSNNNAVGYGALYQNTTGSNNNGQGFYALAANTTGSNNTAIGPYAGYNLTGSNNIDIGNRGVAGESGVIRIGSAVSATYIAGIYGTSVSGNAVMVSPTGQLGVVVSSERFKTAIAPMGSNTTKLAQLRPVTFKLKTDEHGTVQYGLIAEEVARVYPELVIRDQQGKIDGVRYDELAPMLLNEVQKQESKIRGLEQQVAELNSIRDEMRAALQQLRSKDELLARH